MSTHFGWAYTNKFFRMWERFCKLRKEREDDVRGEIF